MTSSTLDLILHKMGFSSKLSTATNFPETETKEDQRISFFLAIKSN